MSEFFVTQFAFSVWVSQDNSFWSLATSGVAFTYERALRRFKLLLPDVQGRFLKIVTVATPPTAPSIQVTEIRVLGPPPGIDTDPTSRFVDESATRSFTGGVSWLVRDNLKLGYDLIVQKTRRHTDDQLSERRRAHRQRCLSSVEHRREHRRQSPGGQSEVL